MKVIFDTKHLYYLPQYEPMHRELVSRGHDCVFVCHGGGNEQRLFSQQVQQLDAEIIWVADDEQALQHFRRLVADWIVFGNRNSYLDEIHSFSKTVQLGHGIGPKPSYYTKSGTPMTVRFVEGEERLKKIQARYPEGNFQQVGYCKLDPLFSGDAKGLNLPALELEPGRPCLLYAPTYNPSSLERFPDRWPEHFPDFNILIKAHSFTHQKKYYRGQRTKLKRWAEYDHVHVASVDEISLVPYLKEADILVSDASSTLFEFVALDKPVIVCNFFKLKWFYRGPFRYRFEKRFGRDNVLYEDISRHINGFDELPDAVSQELAHPETFREQRARYTRDHVGPVDGLASRRIVDNLEAYEANEANDCG
jgi:hypothetical protein